jgi:NADH dehydrogenase
MLNLMLIKIVIAARFHPVASAIIPGMILVTGATGFIGRALVRHLSETGGQVRVLLRSSPVSPRLPRGVPVEVAVASLNDERAIHAALRGVDQIYHLASAASQGQRGNLMKTDVEGTRILAQVAANAGIERLIFLSHIGADRASAFPIQKAKGISEDHIRKSGVPYTIIRSSIVFGPEDRFTNNLAQLLRSAPGFFPVPSDGRTLLQPVWVEDLVTCLIWSLQNPEMVNQTYEVGGGEYLTLRQILKTLMNVTHTRRWLVPMSLPNTRTLLVMLDAFIPRFNVSSYWLDYVAVNRTCPVDNMARTFGLMPARFGYRLDYLARKPWYNNLPEKIQKTLGLSR